MKNRSPAKDKAGHLYRRFEGPVERDGRENRPSRKPPGKAPTALILMGLLLGIPLSLSADNWPRFRGPNGQGVSAERNIPLHWNARSNVVWRVAIPGKGWSSPVVWDNRVFLTTATEGGESCHVLCVDRVSGKRLWNREVFRETLSRKEARNSYATPTPATDGDRVYAVFSDGSLVALKAATGEIAWVNRHYPFYGQHGLGSSPILYDGLLIMARDGSSEGPNKTLGWRIPWDRAYVLALGAKTGREVWKTGRGLSRISHGTPAIWSHGGRAQVISEAGDIVQGFDVKTGERLWSSRVIGEGKVPSVTLGGGLVFTAGGWGGHETVKAFRMGGSGDLGQSNLVWEEPKSMPKVPSMIYLKPFLFAITDGGIGTCRLAATGKLLWQERVGGQFSASPVSAEGRIYLLSDTAETVVIDAGPEFQVLARNSLEGRVQATPAISQGSLFIRSETELFRIGGGRPGPES